MKSMRTTLLALLAMLPLGQLPQAEEQSRNRLPALGDASSAIVSPAIERKLGEQFLRSVRAQVPTYPDALIKNYTEYLIYRLAEASDLESPDLTVAMIDSDQLNAFAAPGGIVGVNLGLFTYATNVHQFASVLAHELAHLSQRHFARGIEEQRKASIPYMAALLASVALMATVGGDAGLAAMTTTQAAMQQGQLRYSRQRESEADRIGIETLARAWREQREDVEKNARQITAALQARPDGEASGVASAETVCRAAKTLMRSADLAHGGFGSGPKFPTPTSLEFLVASLDFLEQREATQIAGFTTPEANRFFGTPDPEHGYPRAQFMIFRFT